MTMLLQFVVSFGFSILVCERTAEYMVTYGTETFEARDFVRTGLES